MDNLWRYTYIPLLGSIKSRYLIELLQNLRSDSRNKADGGAVYDGREVALTDEGNILRIGPLYGCMLKVTFIQNRYCVLRSAVESYRILRVILKGMYLKIML